MVCPGCKRHVENSFLLGLHVDPPGRIMSPDLLDQTEMKEIWVADLDVGMTAEAKNTAALIPYFSEARTALKSASFAFPCKVSSAAIYSVFENPKGTIWLHCWVFRRNQLSNDFSETPGGQVSFKIQDSDGLRVATTIVSDLLADHVQ